MYTVIGLSIRGLEFEPELDLDVNYELPIKAFTETHQYWKVQLQRGREINKSHILSLNMVFWNAR